MPITAMAQRCGVIQCNQRCKTKVYIKEGIVYEAMNDSVHNCPMAQRAREFEGYYNMIQISSIKPKLLEIMAVIDYVEAKNRPLAEAFLKRKQKGRDRNKPKPEIKIASELFTK